jgi:hypothetical protein
LGIKVIDVTVLPHISEINEMWESGSIKLAQVSYHWQILIEHGTETERRFSASGMLHLVGWRVRIVNLRTERAFYGAWCVSHSIIHTTLFLKEYVTHDLNLNSQGKRRLTHHQSKEWLVAMCKRFFC